MKNLFFTLVCLSLSLISFSQTWTPSTGLLYNNPTTTKIGIGTTTPETLLHIDNGALKIGRGTDVTSRTNNFLSFGDGSYIKIGEWEQDDKLSFIAAKGYSFQGENYVEFNNNSIGMLTGTFFKIRTPSGQQVFQLSHTGQNAYLSYIGDFSIGLESSPWISPLTCTGKGEVLINVNRNFGASSTYNAQGYKLAVNGGILCEEVKVITDVPASDYVFEKEYKLKSLSEIEAFVKQHKHLPEVPSAEEFKKNGYKVGQMDDLLLRKIEELTLLLIEQNKEIELLKSKLNK